MKDQIKSLYLRSLRGAKSIVEIEDVGSSESIFMKLRNDNLLTLDLTNAE